MARREAAELECAEKTILARLLSMILAANSRGLAFRINLTVDFLLPGSDSLDSKQWRVTLALGGCVGRIWCVLGRS
jgi:hypothetical protein